MKKKFIGFLVILFILIPTMFTFVSCGKDEPNNQQNNQSENDNGNGGNGNGNGNENGNENNNGNENGNENGSGDNGNGNGDNGNDNGSGDNGNTNTGDENSLTEDDENLLKRIVDTLENDINTNITIYVTAGAEYDVKELTTRDRNGEEVKDAQNLFSGNTTSPGVLISIDGDDIMITFDGESAYFNGVAFYTEDSENDGWEVNYSEGDFYDSLFGYKDAVRNVEVSRYLTNLFNFAKKFGKIKLTTSKENFGDEGQSIELDVISVTFDFSENTKKIFTIANRIFNNADEDYTMYDLVNELINLNRPEDDQLDIALLVKSYTDQLTEETTVGEVFGYIEEVSGIALDDCLEVVFGLMSEFTYYGKPEFDFDEEMETDIFENYLSNIEPMVIKHLFENVPDIDAVKALTLGEIIEMANEEDDNEHFNDGDATYLDGDNDEEELTLGEKLYSLIDMYVFDELKETPLIESSDYRSDFYAFVELLLNNDEISTTFTTTFKMYENHVVMLDFDADFETYITRNLENVQDETLLEDMISVKAKAHINFLFYDFGTTVAVPDMKKITEMRIDKIVTIEENSEEDIVIDFSDIMPAEFVEDVTFKIEVGYDEDTPVYKEVASYNKETNELTIKRSYYNTLRARNINFDVLYITHGRMSFVGNDISTTSRMSIHLIIE